MIHYDSNYLFFIFKLLLAEVYFSKIIAHASFSSAKKEEFLFWANFYQVHNLVYVKYK